MRLELNIRVVGKTVHVVFKYPSRSLLLKWGARGRTMHRSTMELDLQSLFRLHVHSCTQLRPRSSPLPPHLGSCTRSLSVSQNRRHLFVIPRAGGITPPHSISQIICGYFISSPNVSLVRFAWYTLKTPYAHSQPASTNEQIRKWS
jgi:hypothetical protein